MRKFILLPLLILLTFLPAHAADKNQAAETPVCPVCLDLFGNLTY